jgi:hypothetical protein
MLEKVEGAETSDPWTELLQQSRQALATLRAEALEELVGRAECMLAVTLSSDPMRQRFARSQGCGMARVSREIDLLRVLLQASARNLKVLRRAAGDIRDQKSSADGRARWVR